MRPSASSLREYCALGLSGSSLAVNLRPRSSSSALSTAPMFMKGSSVRWPNSSGMGLPSACHLARVSLNAPGAMTSP